MSAREARVARAAKETKEKYEQKKQRERTRAYRRVNTSYIKNYNIVECVSPKN